MTYIQNRELEARNASLVKENSDISELFNAAGVDNNILHERVKTLEAEVHRARTDSRYWDEFNTISKNDSIVNGLRERIKTLEKENSANYKQPG